MWDDIAAALPSTLAQALGVCLYMISEAILGKTRHGSWLGLARNIIWFTIKTTWQFVLAIIKRALPQKEENKNGIDSSNKTS